MDLQSQTIAKLVLLGEMGSGKSSLVLRYVKGQFFDYQVCGTMQETPMAAVVTSLTRRAVFLSILRRPRPWAQRSSPRHSQS